MLLRSLSAGLTLVCGLVLLTKLEFPADKLDATELQSTRFYAEDGQLLFERRADNGGYGTWVELDQISPQLVAATLAGEDHNFYSHPGIDPLGVLRAIGLNLREGRWAYGGSSVTQQLAKLIDPQPRNLKGKLIEAGDALSLEWTLTKEQILTQYLNRAYYGRLAYGVEAAARRFFGKSADQLTLGEASLLAVLPRAPSAYAPDRNPERVKRRRAHVLAKMVERGFITADEAKTAAAEPLQLVSLNSRLEARHVVDQLLMRDELRGNVQTEIDLKLQASIRRALDQHLTDIRRFGATQAGVVVLDNHSGAVRAMVGSRDYEDVAALGANNAVLSRRPAGSTLKPFIYALAFERGHDERSAILDAPSEWRDYLPRNSHEHYHGSVSMAEALASSLNLPAVRLTAELGSEVVAKRLRELGFSKIDATGKRHGLALALGGAPVSLLELATAYATLAREGLWLDSHLVKATSLEPRRVYPTDAVRRVSAVLSNPSFRRLEFGMETPLDLPFEVAAKTGTSSSFCDNWTVGYTRDVTVAVWVGNFDGRPLRGSLAMQGAAPLFQDAMLQAAGPSPAPVSRNPRDFQLEHQGNSQHFAITSPVRDAQLLVDPALPLEVQRVALTTNVKQASGMIATAPAVSTIRWRINGRVFDEAPTEAQRSWPLAPGRHEFIAEALDASGDPLFTSDPVQVVVEGGEDAAYL